MSLTTTQKVLLKGTLGSIDDAVLAIKYAISKGAKIINCSWNFNEPFNDLYDVIKEHQEILFVCAAGNSYTDIDIYSIFPCSYELENVISVMAIDNKGKPYHASGYGKNTVDIAAPGVSVKVILPENEETFIDGTSVATAFVTGAVTLMLSKDANLTPKEIREIVLSSATRKQELNSFCVAGGYLNIEECLISIR